MKCRNCSSGMILDDVDTHFKGNRDNYWICENCDTSCIEKIRNGEVVDTIISQED